jgi:outer membrane protein TolC
MKKMKQITILLLLIFTLNGFDIYPAYAEDNQALPEEEISLSLDQCIQFAITNSYEMKLARLDFLIAQTDQLDAESIYDAILQADISYEKDKRQGPSALLPSLKRTNTYSTKATKTLPSGTELTFSLSDTRLWSDSSFVTLSPSHTAEAAVQARQPIGKNAFGFIDRRNIAKTILTILNADLDTKERIEALLAKVDKAYWQWAEAKKSLAIYGDLLERANDLHLANARNYDIGLIERGDLLASQANVLIREKDLLTARNRYRRAEEQIKLLINLDVKEQIHPEDDLEYRTIDFSLENCLIQAFQTRRDYLKAKRDIDIKDIVLETKANARWPEIDLVASFAANGVDREFGRAMNNITTDDNADYFAGIEISIPFGNRKARAEFNKARHNKEKAILSLKSIERSIVTEVGDAFRDYSTYNINLDKLQEAMRLELEKLKEEEKRFQAARSSTKRLIDYQQDYLYAQLALADGLLDLEKARVDLEKALNIVLRKHTGML